MRAELTINSYSAQQHSTTSRRPSCSNTTHSGLCQQQPYTSLVGSGTHSLTYSQRFQSCCHGHNGSPQLQPSGQVQHLAILLHPCSYYQASGTPSNQWGTTAATTCRHISHTRQPHMHTHPPSLMHPFQGAAGRHSHTMSSHEHDRIRCTNAPQTATKKTRYTVHSGTRHLKCTSPYCPTVAEGARELL